MIRLTSIVAASVLLTLPLSAKPLSANPLAAQVSGFGTPFDPNPPSDVRDGVNLGWGTSIRSLLVDGDHSMVMTRLTGTDRPYSSWSDGRGLEWSPLKALPEGYEPNYFAGRSTLVGESAYFAWTDFPDVFIGHTKDAGASWSAPVRLPIAPFESFFFHNDAVEDLVVLPGSPHDRVYLLVETSEHRLNLLVSEDSGQTFPIVTPVSNFFHNGGKLVVDGSTVHAIYGDGVGMDLSVMHRRSIDGGVTFEPRKLLHFSPEIADLYLDVELDGPVITVVSSIIAAFSQSAWVQRSVDAGSSFAPAVAIPGVTPTILGRAVSIRGDRIFYAHPTVSYLPTTGRVLYTYSTDGGQAWAAPQLTEGVTGEIDQVFLTELGGRPLLTTRADMLTASAYFDDAAGSFELGFLSLSGADGGFAPSIDVRVGVSDVYDNLVSVFVDPDLKVWSTGFRPQRLTPDGFFAGPSVASFDLDQFGSESTLGWVLLALGEGDLILPDGRNLGLSNDPLLATSLDLAAAGVLSATLVPDGAGSTTAVPIGLPPGLTLHAVGVGLDLVAGTVGPITDVVEIGL
ncbi:sialidase family protein [Engelhardtia mirabilis]|uniref:BNR/Asp-box repeat protein n=1 Tax=Engelhardtia mirabilis TaxID=2528011 RepID=A0A518BLS3_9BACT|nr:hypothetical protein Pla133_30100 [Planctomycetes bacterium Pla133]QDV02247.1 hypothetical protein Pla86_30090 [Planctomycetes bacterium Pla86]